MGQYRLEVFLAALGLGLRSFGGPFAHLGYFHQEYVVRRRWVDEAEYAHLLGLCQFLPGPTSSQLAMALGHRRAGVQGAGLAWLGFTLPSALILVALAWGWSTWSLSVQPVVLGLEAAGFAVVAVAAWGLATKLSRGWRRASVTVAALGASALVPGLFQPALLLAAVAAGLVLFPAAASAEPPLPLRTGRGAWAWLAGLGVLLVGLPVLAAAVPSKLTALADGFFRAGALVFGGGHVVLPLLKGPLVGSGLVDSSAFLAGYGLAQALPGPLFSVAAFWGWAADGPWGSLVSLVALFLPSFLLVVGVMPFWTALAARPRVQSALKGVNAAVVGLLAWALVDPLGASVVGHPAVAGLALGLTVLHGVFRVPSGAVAALGAGAGALLGVLGWT